MSLEMSEIAEVLRMAADDLIVNGRAIGQYQDDAQGSRCLIGAVRYASGVTPYDYGGEVEEFLRGSYVKPWIGDRLVAQFSDATADDESVIALLLSVADDIDVDSDHA